MRGIAGWIIARRYNALAATSGFAALGFVFPPLLLISLASLGLVTMRKGGQEGMLVLLGSSGLFLVLGLMASQSIRTDLLILITLWSLLWLLAMVYRHLQTPAWMMNAAGLIGMLLVATFYMAINNPPAFWLSILDQYLRPMFEGQQVSMSDKDLDSLLKTLASVMTGGIAAAIILALISSLLLARWWQAMLFNPGGFRREFHVLQLGRITAVVLMLLLLGSMVGKFSIMTDLATVLWLLYFFQGMAVVHGLIALAGLGIGWLVSLYFLLMLMPNYASPVLSGLGLVDSWFDFRSRVIRKVKPDEDE